MCEIEQISTVSDVNFVLVLCTVRAGFGSVTYCVGLAELYITLFWSILFFMLFDCCFSFPLFVRANALRVALNPGLSISLVTYGLPALTSELTGCPSVQAFLSLEVIIFFTTSPAGCLSWHL